MSCDPKLPTISEVVLKPTPNQSTAAKEACKPTVESPSPSTSSKPSESPPTASSAKQTADEQDEIVTIENVTVKFRLAINQVIAQVYPNCLTLGEVKTDIGRRFEVAPELLILTQNHRTLSDECRIRDTESDEFGIHEFGLSLNVVQKPKSAVTDEVEEEEDEDHRSAKLDLEVYYKYV